VYATPEKAKIVEVSTKAVTQDKMESEVKADLLFCLQREFELAQQTALQVKAEFPIPPSLRLAQRTA
jgi:hypothetical protein